MYSRPLTPDSPRPAVALVHYAPAMALLPWIQSYWVLEQTFSALPTPQKLHPDGGVSLILDLASAAPQATLVASSRLVYQSFSGPVSRLGIRFQPGGLVALFGLDIQELMDTPIPVADLSLPGWDRLFACITDAPWPLVRHLPLLDNWLLLQARAQQAAPGTLQRLLPWLLTGRLDINTLISTQGLSRRTLERLMRDQVGLAPAQLNRLGQIKRARNLLIGGVQPVSSIALDCGFHDQAHFTHHFRRHTDETPGAYRKRKLTQIYNRPPDS
ncbi:helix-turn-helix domain-containing protein [Halopseudomonas sp.]|jgi:AraC-like DNA-binding protein|uniref:helix-turn-helix domain-containing protein n=1 Tax=Halopseudomonas sp. TaxID=2901191 RepID=UPI0039E67669